MQVSFSSWFQELFSNFRGLFDVFWSLCTFFGEEYFFVLILATIYWIYNKRLATILAITYTSACAFSIGVKDLCKIKRPISDENVRFVKIDNIFINTKDLSLTYSFPSKHALAIASVAGGLSLNIKNKKIWIGSIILVIFVCLSRIYLGVSFILDVSIGALLGVSVGYLMYRLFIKLENKYMIIYAIPIVLSLLSLIIERDISSFKLVGAVLGITTGALIEHKFINFDPSEGSTFKKVLRAVIGLIILIALKEGLKYLFNLVNDEILIFHSIRYFVVAMYIVALYPFIFKKIKL